MAHQQSSRPRQTRRNWLFGDDDDEDADEDVDPEKQILADQAFEELYEEEQKLGADGGITADEAAEIAESVKQNHPVLTTLSVELDGETWVYYYSFNPKGKKRGRVKVLADQPLEEYSDEDLAVLKGRLRGNSPDDEQRARKLAEATARQVANDAKWSDDPAHTPGVDPARTTKGGDKNRQPGEDLYKETGVFREPVWVPKGGYNVDHIKPFEVIWNMPIFKKLTFDEAVEVMNYKPNLISKNASENKSRQNKSYAKWQGHNEFGELDQDYHDEMIELEADLAEEVDERIKDFLKARKV